MSDPSDYDDTRDEVPYPAWLEEDQYRDRDEEAYNEWLMNGGDA